MIRISTGTAKEDKSQPTTTSGGSENEPQSIVGGEVVVDAFDREQMLAPLPPRSVKQGLLAPGVSHSVFPQLGHTLCSYVVIGPCGDHLLDRHARPRVNS
jgi:hypothetical protein